ncbi:MAG: hypothetical protein WB699_14460 [Bacteroidota bacterium]
MSPRVVTGQRSINLLRSRAFALVAFIAIGVVRLWAQESARPETTPFPATADSLLHMNSAGVVLDRNLDIFNWNGHLFLDTTLGTIRTNIREQYSTTIVQFQSDPSRLVRSSQQQINASFRVPLSAPLSATSQWNSFIFTDSRGIGLSKASMHSLMGGLAYTPLTYLSVEPSAGYRWDNQSDNRDHGPSYQLLATLQPLDEDGYLLSASGQLHVDQLSPRRLENHFLQAGVEKSFGPVSKDSLGVAVYRLRREFYSPDSSIESRQETFFQISNLLSYEVDPTLRATFFLGILSRGLDKLLFYSSGIRPRDAFDTHVDEFHLDAYIEGSWRSTDGRASANIRFGHNERNELHRVLPASEQTTGPLLADRTSQEESKNNLAKQTELSGRFLFPVSWSDIIFATGRASLLRYDTPSNLNDEDRDELLVALSAGSFHQISPVFRLGFSLEGTMSHLVYLLSDRSANNNINRILRLTPRMVFTPAWFLQTTNGFEVLASYTVYDYEQQAALVQSYTYRQFGWLDTTSVELTHRVGLDFYAYLKLYERGQLNWADFTERTENSYVDRNFSGQARFRPSPEFFIAVGVRYFSQTRYAYDETGKVIDSYLRSIGPTCSIHWFPGPHSAIDLQGWYENRRQTDGSIRGLTTLTFSLLYNF